MKRSLRFPLGILFALGFGSGALLAQSDPDPDAIDSSEPKRRLLEPAFQQKFEFAPEDHGGCTAVGTLSCPNASTNGSLASTDCQLNDDSYADTFHFSGTAGQVVTINMTSTAFDTFLILRGPSGNVATFDDDGGTGLNSLIVFTLNATGTWAVVANSVQPNIFGAYSLTMSCTGTTPGTCTANATSLCLSGNRFRVQANYRTVAGATGAGTAVPLTADSGYFWFFDSANVEIVTKVLNACSFSGHIWVFAAGLTNVEVTFVVTDTKTGAQKTYTNPLNRVYVTQTDTTAFDTCP